MSENIIEFLAPDPCGCSIWLTMIVNLPHGPIQVHCSLNHSFVATRSCEPSAWLTSNVNQSGQVFRHVSHPPDSGLVCFSEVQTSTCSSPSSTTRRRFKSGCFLCFLRFALGAPGLAHPSLLFSWAAGTPESVSVSKLMRKLALPRVSSWRLTGCATRSFLRVTASRSSSTHAAISLGKSCFLYA
jgi:hypothetical protein